MERKGCKQQDSKSGDEHLAMLFRKTSKMMARAHHRHSHAQHAQAHVYSLVKEKGPISQKDLMQILDVRSSSLSEVIRKLEQADLIVRERNKEDKRGFIVYVKDGFTPPFAEQEEKQTDKDFLFAALDDEEKQQLSALLKKIIASVKMGEEAGHSHHHGRHQEGSGKGHHKKPSREKKEPKSR